MHRWIMAAISLTFLMTACMPKQPTQTHLKPNPIALEQRQDNATTCESLWQALQDRDLAAFEAQLTAGAHPHCLNTEGEWPLFFLANVWKPWILQAPAEEQVAVEAELWQLTALLLQHGADPDFDTPDKASALYMAVFFDIEKMMVPLLEKGGDPHQMSPNGMTPLQAAGMMGHPEAEKLLRKYAD